MSGIDLDPVEKNIWRIVQMVREVFRGRSLAVGEVTLSPGATTTVVVATNCGKDSKPQLTPKTLNAAAAYATTFVGTVNQGSFVVTHANNAQTDRTFHWHTPG